MPRARTTVHSLLVTSKAQASSRWSASASRQSKSGKASEAMGYERSFPAWDFGLHHKEVLYAKWPCATSVAEVRGVSVWLEEDSEPTNTNVARAREGVDWAAARDGCGVQRHPTTRLQVSRHHGHGQKSAEMVRSRCENLDENLHTYTSPQDGHESRREGRQSAQ